MICDKCGSEKFEIIKVTRHRTWSDSVKKFVYSPDSDIRRIVCTDCGLQYWTITTKKLARIFDNKLLKLKEIPVGQLKLWD